MEVEVTMKTLFKYFFASIFVGLSAVVYQATSRSHNQYSAPSFAQVQPEQVNISKTTHKNLVVSDRQQRRADKQAQLEQQTIVCNEQIPVVYQMADQPIGHTPVVKSELSETSKSKESEKVDKQIQPIASAQVPSWTGSQAVHNMYTQPSSGAVDPVYYQPYENNYNGVQDIPGHYPGLLSPTTEYKASRVSKPQTYVAPAELPVDLQANTSREMNDATPRVARTNRTRTRLPRAVTADQLQEPNAHELPQDFNMQDFLNAQQQHQEPSLFQRIMNAAGYLYSGWSAFTGIRDWLRPQQQAGLPAVNPQTTNAQTLGAPDAHELADPLPRNAGNNDQQQQPAQAENRNDQQQEPQQLQETYSDLDDMPRVHIVENDELQDVRQDDQHDPVGADPLRDFVSRHNNPSHGSQGGQPPMNLDYVANALVDAVPRPMSNNFATVRQLPAQPGNVQLYQTFRCAPSLREIFAPIQQAGLASTQIPQSQNLQVAPVAAQSYYAQFKNYLAHNPVARNVYFTAMRILPFVAQAALTRSSGGDTAVADEQAQEALLDAAVNSFRPRVNTDSMFTSSATTAALPTTQANSWLSPWIVNLMLQGFGQAQALGRTGIRA